MTIQEIIQKLGPYSLYIFIYLILIPVLSFVYSKICGKERGIMAPHKYIYAVLIYLIAIPGIFGGVLTAYSLFILRANLLQVNFLIYILPVLSMIVTFIFISKGVDLNEVPGFDRLYGLLVVLGVTFILTLGIMKTRIWIFFGGSITTLLIIGVVLFILLKWGTRKLFQSKNDHKF